jgi:quercetin dioxygenase-like cupin family protein
MKYAFQYSELEEQKVADGLVRRLVHTDNLMMVQIEFTDGPTSAPDPFHSHPHEQVAFVAEGEIILFVADEPGVHLKPGDHYAIPSGIPHTIQRLSAYIKIIDCFTPIREDFLKK